MDAQFNGKKEISSNFVSDPLFVWPGPCPTIYKNPLNSIETNLLVKTQSESFV